MCTDYFVEKNNCIIKKFQKKDVEKYLSQREMEKKDEEMAIRLQKELSGA